MLEAGVDGVDTARDFGIETFERARSVTDKLPIRIAERARRRRADDEERDEKTTKKGE